jgi:hypothetical protein
VDETVTFSGRALDSEDGDLADSALSWTLVVRHCPSNCHSHTAQGWTGVKSGSFSAPDHEYPSYLELRLTATDSSGSSATTSVDLLPLTVDLAFASIPGGAGISVGPTQQAAPFTRTVIVGSTNSVSAAPQLIDGVAYQFASWSDGGAATHNLVAPPTATTFTATFGPNAAPTAVATASPSRGPAPLTVNFDGSTSHDPDPGDVLGYAWDLDGDGAFDDATGATTQRTYTAPGTVIVRLRTTDPAGAEGVSGPISLTIEDVSSPTVAITAPVDGANVGGTQLVTASASDSGSGVAGVQFKLDGANLGGEDTSTPYTISWDTTQVTGGQHTLTAVARDAAGNTATSAPVVVNVQNGLACPTGEWKAEYFTNLTLTGSPAVTRCEQAIDNGWGTGSPVAGVGADNFSVRWSGRFTFRGGSTTFVATADDGVRVRLDGSVVIDQWRDQAAATFVALRTVGAGAHDITVEYYERSGQAVARVSWREGLVAAYNFDESTGTTAGDRSGNGNTGTVSGATRTTSGRNGRALSFDGINDWVTIADANSLDLSNGLTLESWVYPTALGSTARAVLYKEATGTSRYALYANTSSRPGARVDVGGGRTAIGAAQLSLNTWTHIAATFDGVTLNLFVNGVAVSSTPAAGSIAASTAALRIGGHAVASEWFRGRIDDVRVYSRALSVAEIQADRTAAVP